MATPPVPEPSIVQPAKQIVYRATFIEMISVQIESLCQVRVTSLVPTRDFLCALVLWCCNYEAPNEMARIPF